MSTLPTTFKPDVVVLGGGLTGCVVTLELLRLDPTLKVLVIEAGSIPLRDHGQAHLAGRSLYDGLFAARWRSDTNYPPSGIVEALGGSTLAWSGWSPRPQPSELDRWPAPVAKALRNGLLSESERWLGVREYKGAGNMASRLTSQFADAHGDSLLRHITGEIHIAPIALSAAGHTFSPLPRLLDAMREHRDRLQVMVGRRVLSMQRHGATISLIRTDGGDVAVPPHAAVVLCLSAIESTRQTLLACPELSAAGASLGGHGLSEISLRIPLERPAREFECAALLIPAFSGDRHFHVQVHAAAGPVERKPATYLRRVVPGLYGDELLSGVDERHLVVNLAALGELPDQGPTRPAITLAAELDPFGVPAVSVAMPPEVAADPVFDLMDDVLDDLCEVLLRPGVRFRPPGRAVNNWLKDPPPRRGTTASGRRWQRTVHQSGSLRMAPTPAEGATDLNGAVFGMENLFATGLSLFPRPGSHNGALTATALALRLARNLAQAHCS